MSKDQLDKTIKVFIITTFIMLVCEIIFSFKAVTDFFGNWITTSNGIYVYVIIWIIMFLQVTILNIPAYVVLSACFSIGLEILSWQYLLTVITAYMCGCILAYWLGRGLGVKAVKWCAGSEEEFDKWCTFMNKKGRMWYFLTILLPLFPDDLLCLVAGSVKLNFGFYTIANAIGRSVGLVTMILVIKLVGLIGGNGFPFMIIAWAVALVIEIVIYCINKKSLQQSKGLNK